MNDSTVPPAPMSEEGTTVPADSPITDQFDPGDTVIVSQELVYDDDDDTSEPDATAGEPEPDRSASEPALTAAPADDEAPEQVTTEEYAVADVAGGTGTVEDDTTTYVVSEDGTAEPVPSDDGTGVEDADVETPVDDAGPDDEVASADAVAAAAPADTAPVEESPAADTAPVDGTLADEGQEADESTADEAAAAEAPADAGTAVETTPDDAAPAAAQPGVQSSENDFLIGHVFDQTNGVVEGIDGDGDGTAAAEESSDADRHGMNEPNPVGQQDAFHDDYYGESDGKDPNP